MNCIICKTEISEGFYQCPSCKYWNTYTTHNTTHNKLLPTLASITSTPTERIISGPWDPCFGKGIVVTSVTLLGGEPGAGKSTLSLQIADSIAGIIKDKFVYYMSAEEGLGDVHSRANRLRLKNLENIRMYDLLEDDEENPSSVINGLQLIENTPPSLGILDSISGVCGNDIEAAVKVAKDIKPYCVKHKFPFIIIAHLNKKFEITGALALQHAVDTTIGLAIDADDDSDDEETDKRILISMKNRFGASKVKVNFQMTGEGLILFKEKEKVKKRRKRNREY